MKYIEFLPFLPVNNTFEYKTTLNVEVGDILKCRFGKFDALGIALNIHNIQQTQHKLASVSSIVFKQLIKPEQILLIKKLESYYGYDAGLFGKLFFPFSIKNCVFSTQEEMVKLSSNATVESSRSQKWQIIYNTLKHGNAVESSTFTGLSYFKSKGLLEIFQKAIEFKNYQFTKITESTLPELSNEQAKTFNDILNDSINFQTHLIHGKTGSGKTEVYTHLIQKICQQYGKQAQILVMLPEIGLAKVIAQRLEKRLECKIPIWHSSTPENQRKQYFQEIQSGTCNVIVGTRSALFLPFQNLKTIIVDEEHDGSYKQEETPVYHARDAAILYGKTLNISVILGSATPSVESYYNAQNQKYKLHKLNARFANVQMPEIKIVNEKTKGFLSETLRQKILEYYYTRKQILVFINRRGFAPINRCKACKGVFKCDSCDALLTYHKKKGVLACHKCSFFIPTHSNCTMCGENIEINSTGAGVEAIYEEVLELIEKSEPRVSQDFCGSKNGDTPECEHRTLDKNQALLDTKTTHNLPYYKASSTIINDDHRNTTNQAPYPFRSLSASHTLGRDLQGCGAHPSSNIKNEIAIFSSDEQNTENKLSKFIENVQNGKIKIIIGTQIASKGYDFPNLKLVCIVDLILKNDEIDFKCDEKLMQLLIQVSGRSGRSGDRGLVLIQSKRKETELLRLVNEDQNIFYDEEVKIRKQNFFPPFSRFTSITVFGTNEKSTALEANKIAEEIRKTIKCNIFGPAPAPIAFIKNTYRYKILLISNRSQLEISNKVRNILNSAKCKAKIDVDTINFY
jgi:primosomal protein N'